MGKSKKEKKANRQTKSATTTTTAKNRNKNKQTCKKTNKEKNPVTRFLVTPLRRYAVTRYAVTRFTNNPVLNVNKKFFQTDKFSRPWFSQNRGQNFRSGAAEKKMLSFKTPIHDSHEQNTVFHFSSIRYQTSMLQLYVSLNNENQSLPGRGKFSKNFALNSPPKNKCRFAISHEQNNSFHLTCNLTSCKHRHRYYSGIISNNCEFLLKAHAYVASYADALWARHAIFLPHRRSWGRNIAWRAQRASA